VITAIDPAAVLFTLPQDRLTDITQALAAGTVEVDVFNRDGTTLLGKGALTVLDNQVNAATATMRMKAIVPNPGHVLWPNAFVKARALVATKKDVVVVPAAAVQQGPAGSFVYVVGADSTVKMTPVVVTLTQGDISVIEKGLAGGEQVVIEGANQLRNGGKVDTGQHTGTQPPALPPGLAGAPSDRTSRGHRGSGATHPTEAARPPSGSGAR
jgi:multidrug efflux system membrane fusion protein